MAIYLSIYPRRPHPPRVPMVFRYRPSIRALRTPVYAPGSPVRFGFETRTLQRAHRVGRRAWRPRPQRPHRPPAAAVAPPACPPVHRATPPTQRVRQLQEGTVRHPQGDPPHPSASGCSALCGHPPNGQDRPVHMAGCAYLLHLQATRPSLPAPPSPTVSAPHDRVSPTTTPPPLHYPFLSPQHPKSGNVSVKRTERVPLATCHSGTHGAPPTWKRKGLAPTADRCCKWGACPFLAGRNPKTPQSRCGSPPVEAVFFPSARVSPP